MPRIKKEDSDDDFDDTCDTSPSPSPSASHSKKRDAKPSTGSKSNPTTPTKGDKQLSTTESASSSPSKRKRSTADAVSPSNRGKFKQKWLDWEDKIMKEAVLDAADKTTDWKTVLAKINAGRQNDDPRTMKGIKLHWTQKIKNDMLRG